MDLNASMGAFAATVLDAAEKITPSWSPVHVELWTNAIQALAKPFLLGIAVIDDNDPSVADCPVTQAAATHRPSSSLLPNTASVTVRKGDSRYVAVNSKTAIFAAQALGTTSKLWKVTMKRGTVVYAEFFKRLFWNSPEIHAVFDQAVNRRHTADKVAMSIEHDPLLSIHAAKLFDTLTNIFTSKQSMNDMVPHFQVGVFGYGFGFLKVF
jgi:hypothetical protein